MVIDQGHLNIFGNNAFNAGVIASYVPLRDKDGTGEIVCVFEVYNDVTDFIFQIQHTARKLSTSIAISLSILYLFFFRLLRHGKGKSPIPYLKTPDSEALQTRPTTCPDRNIPLTIEALRRSEARFKQAAAIANLGHRSCNEQDRLYMDFSEEYARIHGYDIDVMRREFSTFEQQHQLSYFEDRQRCLNAYQSARDKQQFSVEYRVLRPDGAVRHVRRIGVIVSDNNGLVKESRGTLQDITQTKLAETERLSHAHNQHEILTREMHHRIKNNLQGIIGLLQQYHRDEPRLVSAIEQVTSQVGTIARVHGLQAGHRQEIVPLKDLIKSITHAAVARASVDVSFNSTLSDASLSETEATPIALIINELVTNAIKHTSRVAIHPAKVNVALDPHDSGVCITIKNTPSTLPRGFNLEQGVQIGNGLGLVNLLLPRNSSAISIFEHDNSVSAALVLRSPVIFLGRLSGKNRIDNNVTAGTI